MFIDFRERGREREKGQGKTEKERERNINQLLPRSTPTRDQSHNLLVFRRTIQPTEPPDQG